ncbi:hypothetical protein DFA_00513 [Cavenderia fasciculata]|uniref:Uncharacterized protein n=1 Tax=Cavenderia fasciculata TaxID=261658 RepID=F4PSA6_CACFS|nr:uncharacterized protein DFA_00513 [Cavenderia fasciculata]EGG20652.1 hypothetical protein DFA_00513 [Cavenderia fasciculata]|eukprot:XP_004358502.1 hypothetical protein DFA_00513 [Cavenderia fasciculata]
MIHSSISFAACHHPSIFDDSFIAPIFLLFLFYALLLDFPIPTLLYIYIKKRRRSRRYYSTVLSVSD